MSRLPIVVLFILFVGMVRAADAQVFAELAGDLGIHDPSVIYVESTYVAFSTGVERAADGGAIRIKTSGDGIDWTDAGTLGTGLPDWVAPALGKIPPNLWAPSVSVQDGVLFVYYAASSFGKNRSAIGLTVNKGFDPADPGSGWQDRGIVFQSFATDNFNAIDPVRLDTEDGRAFLAFGSWWDGIRMIELDPETGMRLNATGPVMRLASRGGGAIEAPSLMEHDGHYFLFVSFDHCCRGATSDYNVRVGRAGSIAGPYLDRSGLPMLEGGGTLIMESTGRYRGPGGQEVFFASDGQAMLAFHYYDLQSGAAPKLQIAPLVWDTEGWPLIGDR